MSVFLKPTPEAPLFIAFIHQQRRRIILFKAVGVDDNGYVLTVIPSHEYGGTGNRTNHLRYGVPILKAYDKQALAELLKSSLAADCREYVMQTFYDQNGPETVSLFRNGKFVKIPVV